MQNSQQRFTDQLTGAATADGFELTQDRSYSNLGQFHAFAPNAVDPFCSIGFDFQTGYASFRLIDKMRRDVRKLHYVQTGEMGAAFETIRAFIKSQAPAKKPAARARKAK